MAYSLIVNGYSVFKVCIKSYGIFHYCGVFLTQWMRLVKWCLRMEQR